MAKQRTAEEVAREIVDHWRLFPLGEPQDSTLVRLVASALRQREQETAAVCAALVAAAGKANDFDDSNWAFQQIIEELVEAILSRFPKDQG